MERSRGSQLADAVGLVAVAATLAAGLVLRLQEPLSSPVIPAEDPFTHMARLKAHLAAGSLEPTDPFGEELYPPGMHALLAAVWAFTGEDLYTIVRFSPVVFGGLSILGTALLLWHHAGRLAAFVGGLAVALAPELVFRTTMMAPTAIDVALLGFTVYALLAVVADLMGWVPPAALLTLYLVFSHPWLIGMLAAAGLVFGLLTLAVPWSAEEAPRPSARGLAAGLGVVGGALALVLSTCAGLCGPGYQQVLPGGASLLLAAPVVLAATAIVGGLLWVRAADPSAPIETGRRSLVVRLGVAAMLGGALAGLTWLALQRGFPEFVDLPRMLGWPLIGLGALGVVGAPLLAGPLTYTALGLGIATYPLTIFPLLGSGFVSHRVVAYLGLAAALLAGGLVQGLARGGALVGARGARSRRWAGVSAGTLALTVAVAGVAAGTLAVTTPGPYDEGWYRLYEPCEMEGLQEVADRVGSHPRSVVVTGDWRPNTVLSALVDPGPRVWVSDSFFVSASERRGIALELEAEDGSAYLLVDRHLRTEKPDVDLGFLDEEPWTATGSWCGAELGSRYQMTLYVHERTR
ncbi:hypothetical protein BRD56_00125 [Thermoplasmatales archaeon SW_10_69_26]|nr:MAG: hypothetical protein BRD56_00125 [Thermoplasmatales archaeon SW_10_69_26]